LRQRGAAVIAVSADTTFCHAEFLKARGFSFPLLSDVHRSVIKAYGVHDEDRNVAYRSTFIIDRDGALRWGQAGDRLMVRDGSEVLRVLDVLESTRKPATK
jgi:alkyl hydroperoxide reductase subunit AhpC